MAERFDEEPEVDGRSAGPPHYEGLSDQALVAAMRKPDERAVLEFMRRFRHLALVQARRHRIPQGARTQWVSELLCDVARTLIQRSAPIPTSISRYLIGAGKWKVISARRDRMVREHREREAVGEVGGMGEGAALGLCSEDSVRNTYGPGWEPAGLSPVLRGLAAAIQEEIAPDERKLLSWVGARVPYSQIAEWLGITRSAAVKRVTRLRARLLETARRFAESVERGDRHELLRFLRRTRAFDDLELDALADASTAPGRR